MDFNETLGHHNRTLRGTNEICQIIYGSEEIYTHWLKKVGNYGRGGMRCGLGKGVAMYWKRKTLARYMRQSLHWTQFGAPMRWNSHIVRNCFTRCISQYETREAKLMSICCLCDNFKGFAWQIRAGFSKSSNNGTAQHRINHMICLLDTASLRILNPP